jgi:hypothetical protein
MPINIVSVIKLLKKEQKHRVDYLVVSIICREFWDLACVEVPNGRFNSSWFRRVSMRSSSLIVNGVYSCGIDMSLSLRPDILFKPL